MLFDHAPDEDDALDTTWPPQPVHYAEQALLGALLQHPHRLADLDGIEPASFSHPAHGALFAAIRALPAPGPEQHAKDAGWLTAVLTAARRHTRGLTAAYLHTLIQTCPRPRHAPAYARMVQADHARRTVRAQARRLTQAATDPTLPHPVPATLAEADALARCLDGLAARFPPHPRSHPRTPAPPASDRREGHEEEALDEEQLLLATATAHPAEIEQMRWLIAQDFTHPLHAGLWQCLTDLTRRGAAVDPVTVLWQAQHTGLLTGDIAPPELLALLAAPAGSPQFWGERILQRAVLATAQDAGVRIEALADDPATTPYQLVAGSRRALADLAAVRTRWNLATQPALPTGPTPSTSAPPRAGPPPTTTPPSPRIAR
jgi:replicative DNA helicase